MIIRLFIIDPDIEFVNSFRKDAYSSEKVQVIGSSPDIETSIDLISKNPPDIVLLDEEANQGKGLVLAKTVSIKFSDVPIYLTTEDPDYIKQWREAKRKGLAGIIKKPYTVTNVVQNVAEGLDGEEISVARKKQSKLSYNVFKTEAKKKRVFQVAKYSWILVVLAVCGGLAFLYNQEVQSIQNKAEHVEGLSPQMADGSDIEVPEVDGDIVIPRHYRIDSNLIERFESQGEIVYGRYDPMSMILDPLLLADEVEDEENGEEDSEEAEDDGEDGEDDGEDNGEDGEEDPDEKVEYEISLSAEPSEGAGSLVGEGTYTEGTSVEIAASTADGYEFKHWEYGDETYEYEIVSHEVKEDIELIAVFQKEKHKVVFRDAQGVIEEQDVEHGSDADPPPDPEREGYEFAGWEIGDYENVVSDQVLYAAFEPKEYEVEVNKEGEGEVFGSGTYKHGDTVIVRAEPAEGWRFDGWEEIDQDGVHQVKLTEDMEFTAIFVEIEDDNGEDS